jgi:hypothetical protein
VDAVQDDQEQEDGGGMELVLGDIPSAAEETTTTTSTSTDTPSSIRNQTSLISFVVDQETTYDYGTTTKSSESESNTKDTEQQQGIEEEDVATMVKLVQEKLKAVESKERLISQIKSFDSADKPPRVYEDDDSDDSSGGIVLDEPRVPIEPTTVTVTATEAAAAVTPEKSSLPQPDGLVTPVKSSPMSVSSQASQTPFDQKAVQRPTFVGGEDPTIREQRGGNADNDKDKDNAKDTRKRMSPEAVTKKLLQAFSCAGDMLPEKLQKHIPNINACATDYTCMPTTMSKQMVPKRKPLYNDQFAVDFLDVRYQDVCVCVVCRHQNVSSHLLVCVCVSLSGIVKCWICLGLSSTTHRGAARLDWSQCHHVVTTRHLQCQNNGATPAGMVHHGWWHGATSRNQVGSLVKDSFRHQLSYG